VTSRFAPLAPPGAAGTAQNTETSLHWHALSRCFSGLGLPHPSPYRPISLVLGSSWRRSGEDGTKAPSMHRQSPSEGTATNALDNPRPTQQKPRCVVATERQWLLLIRCAYGIWRTGARAEAEDLGGRRVVRAAGDIRHRPGDFQRGPWESLAASPFALGESSVIEGGCENPY
jgi:hypothetical protein